MWASEKLNGSRVEAKTQAATTWPPHKLRSRHSEDANYAVDHRLLLRSRTRRRLRWRCEPLQFSHCLVQLLFLVLGRAFEAGRVFHQAGLRIDCDFKVRAN